MTTIYLIRHGHIENPTQVFYGSEFHLSERGCQQIIALGKEMHDAGITPALSRFSPFIRTTESCEILNAIFNISDTSPDDRLREWNVNSWFNKPLAEFYAATNYKQTPPRLDDPRVETLEHMATRVIDVINDVQKNIQGSTAFIVGHREPLVSAVLKLQGLPWDTIHEIDFPVASAWEMIFDGSKKCVSLRKRFDHHLDT